MVVVITNATAIKDEHTIINKLFDVGLEVLHLRKPGYTQAETETLLTKINPTYYSKIALHNHPKLVDEFSLTRIHLTEDARRQTGNMALSNAGSTSKIMSTSIHHVEEYKNIATHFQYCFFGPVFNSISKPGYQPVIKSGLLNLPTTTATKIIALGGIDETKIDAVKDLGFAGIALLGTVWQNQKPVEQFRRIHKKWYTSETAF